MWGRLWEWMTAMPEDEEFFEPSKWRSAHDELVAELGREPSTAELVGRVAL